MNAVNVFEVLRAPRVSEKTARMQEVSNQYAFEVSREASKADIKAAVEQAVRRQREVGERGQREGQEPLVPQPCRPPRRLAQGVRDPGRWPVDRRHVGQGLRTVRCH